MSEYIGKESLIEIDGKQYKLGRFDRHVLSSFLDWCGKELPHPLDVIQERIGKFPPHLQEVMLKDACLAARQKLSLNSPEVQGLMATPKGIMKICSLLFQKHHPELTDAVVEKIFDEKGEEYLWKKIEVASGRFPQDAK